MKTRPALLTQAAIVALTAVYSLIMVARLPDRVPTHWNLQGQIDAYGSKWTALLTMPAAMIFTVALGLILPAISPKNFKIDEFRGTFNYVVVVLMSMLGVLQVIIVQASAQTGFDIFKAMMLLMFVAFALIGNVIGKTRRNFYMGVRTPWTLASERVWIETHRSAGRLWVIGSLIGIVLSLTPLPAWFDFTFFMGITCWPILDSYLIYRRVEGSL